jgi:hypothetical protein
MSHINTEKLINFLDSLIKDLRDEEENEGELDLYFDQIEDIEQIKSFVLENSI